MEKIYHHRLLEPLIKEYLEGFSALLIEGAKAVGKTESCKQIVKTTYRLNLPETQNFLSLSPEIILEKEKPVLLDDWQRLPMIWDFVRHAIDDGLNDGSVLLTGSSPELFSDLDSGAGRIGMLKMRPYSIEERNMAIISVRLSNLLENDNYVLTKSECNLKQLDYLHEIFKSGFPEIREKGEKFIPRYLSSYINQISTRDIPENGIKVNKPAALNAWLKTYAAASGTVTSYSTILLATSNNTGEQLNKNTAANYKEALENINVIEEVQAWLPIGKLFNNLGKVPKHFIVDPSFIPILLDFDLDNLIQGEIKNPIGKINKTMVGQLFETFIYQSLATYAQVNEATISHFRTSSGDREIDFII